VLRTASYPTKLAGPIAVRSTQFGGVRCAVARLVHRVWNSPRIYCALSCAYLPRLYHSGLPQTSEITGLHDQFLGVDFDVVLAELGRETTLAQRRRAGPYERPQHS
jgi:hypothetical protein